MTPLEDEPGDDDDPPDDVGSESGDENEPQADVNARDSSNMTPLHVHVVLSEHVVTALIKAKAKVDAADLQGGTSLQCLVLLGEVTARGLKSD
jgi:ankyrin repeat protein